MITATIINVLAIINGFMMDVAPKNNAHNPDMTMSMESSIPNFPPV